MRLQVDLTVVVVRDDADGFIGWHQDEQGRDRHGVDVTNPDLCALAESFGGTGRRMAISGELGSAVDRARAEPGVPLTDCPTDDRINETL